MDKFFHPSSIAIIGASQQAGKIGNILVRNLVELKFKGRIFPVNPKYDTIENLACYPGIQALPEEVDLAVIAIPAAMVPQAVEECARNDRPIKNIIIISAGFSEIGDEGKKLEDKIKFLAKKYHLNIAGPNCLGMLNTRIGLNASFSKNNFVKGKIGLIMQSGAFTTALFDIAQGENFGFSLVATLGNKAVLDEVDFLDYYSKDDATEIIGMYIEDIRRGKEFCQALRRVSGKKPVLILKAGNSKKAQAAMQSHTGAMAGEADVAREAIMESGGYYFDNLDGFICAMKIFSGFQLPKSNQLALVTNAGGPGVVVTDLVEKNGALSLKNFTPEQKKSMKALLPEAASVENPVDVLGDADENRYAEIFNCLQEMPEIGAVLSIVTPQAQTDIEKITEVIREANKKCPFPVFPVVLGAEAAEIAEKQLRPDGYTNFVFTTDLVNALEAIISLRPDAASASKQKPSLARRRSGQAIFEKVKSDSRQAFYYDEARQLAELYGLPAAGSVEISSFGNTSVDLEYPLVLKIDSPAVVHKNAKDALILNIQSQEELEEAFKRLRTAFPDEKVIAQHQVQPGFEVIMGIKNDPSFGQVLMVGIGGILTEILGIKFLWILPATSVQIRSKLDQSPIQKLFQKQKLDYESLIRLIGKLGEMAVDNPDIQELDVNPIIFYPGKEPVAVDIKIML